MRTKATAMELLPACLSQGSLQSDSSGSSFDPDSAKTSFLRRAEELGSLIETQGQMTLAMQALSSLQGQLEGLSLAAPRSRAEASSGGVASMLPLDDGKDTGRLKPPRSPSAQKGRKRRKTNRA